MDYARYCEARIAVYNEAKGVREKTLALDGVGKAFGFDTQKMKVETENKSVVLILDAEEVKKYREEQAAAAINLGNSEVV